MSKLINCIWIGLFLSLSLGLSGQDSALIREKIHDLLSDYYANQEFSGVVLVAKKGAVFYHHGMGYAQREQEVMNTKNTRFLIGSATKSFTAIAIMQCVEKGLLELHRPIIDYLPELNASLGQLSLHQLMKNSSGLPVHLNRVTDLEYRDISSAELLELYAKLKPSFTPGTRFEYSNLNYQLCALVLERVSGEDYATYLSKHIFDPLNMTQTGVERTHDLIPERAKGYTLEHGSFIRTPKNYLAYAMGGGDIYSTANDLLKWHQGLYSGKLLTQKSMKLLNDGQPGRYGGYGYGFKVKEYVKGDGKTGKLVRHGGSMYGFVCNIHRYLEDEVTIVVLGNIRPYPVMEITLSVEKVLLENGALLDGMH